MNKKEYAVDSLKLSSILLTSVPFPVYVQLICWYTAKYYIVIRLYFTVRIKYTLFVSYPLRFYIDLPPSSRSACHIIFGNKYKINLIHHIRGGQLG
jgi:hypothetical protein